MKEKEKNELLHYVLVYIVILFSWPIVMTATNDITFTVPIIFGVFIVADKIAHKMFGLK